MHIQHTKIYIFSNYFTGPKVGYPCSHCDASFTSKHNLLQHVRSVHEKRQDFECEHCGKKMATWKRLKDHTWQSHNPVNCEICQKQISNPIELKRHVVFVHKNTKGAWLCEKCPKSVFFSTSSYEKHVKNKH